MNYPNKITLGFYPTPIHKLENISKKFQYNVFIKRDDLTGLAFGGNKTRKLEYLIAHALELGAKTIVTEGAAQSNHARQTAAAARKYGLEPHLILYKPEPQDHNGNLLINTFFNAKIHWANRENIYKERIKILGVIRDCHGKNPYFIPMGGSNEIGLWGYIDAIDELKTQIELKNYKFDFIVFASSSGGTQAGMLLGKKIFDLKAEIIGIEIDKNMYKDKTLKEHILNIYEYTCQKFNLAFSINNNDIHLINDYNEAGYGVITDLEKRAIKIMAQEEAILLDPVYTARAFGALLELMKKQYFPKNSNILFWHTGGQPAIFAYKNDLFTKHIPGKDNLELISEI